MYSVIRYPFISLVHVREGGLEGVVVVIVAVVKCSALLSRDFRGWFDPEAGLSGRRPWKRRVIVHQVAAWKRRPFRMPDRP